MTIEPRRSGLLWRLHFWSALIASPFVLVACLTGLLYVFTPQIERALHGHLDTVMPTGAERRSLDEALQAATLVAPKGWALHSVVPAFEAEDSVRVAFVAPPSSGSAGAASGGGHRGHGSSDPSPGATPGKPQFLRPNFGLPGSSIVIYVNPYTAQVLGELKESDRFARWGRRLHSSLLQGDSWRWMVELAASWTLVMLITGLILWWPRPGAAGLPRAGATGRLAWRQWHAFIGVSLSLVSLVILTTGLTWSQYSGGQVKVVRDLLGQGSPRIPASIRSNIPSGDEKASPLSWEAARVAVQSEAPAISFQLMAPMGPAGVWRANQMDRGHPTKRFDLLLDAYTGERLYFSGWSDQTTFGKATAIGIPFHRGEFGLWNQVLLFVFGTGVIFSLISGWVMFLKRRARGASLLPPVAPQAWKRIGPVTVISALLALVAMPVLAVSSLVVLLGEAVLVMRRSRNAIWVR